MEGVPVQSFEMSGDLALTESSEQLGSYLQPSPLDKQDLRRQHYFSTVFQPQRPQTRCCLREANRPITPCLNSFKRTTSPGPVSTKRCALSKQVTMWKERGRLWSKQKAELEQRLATFLRVPLSKAGEIRLRTYEAKITDLQKELKSTQMQLQAIDPTRTFRLSEDLAACQAELLNTRGLVADRDSTIKRLNQVLREKEIRGKMLESEASHLKQLREEEERVSRQNLAALNKRCGVLENANAKAMHQLEEVQNTVAAKNQQLHCIEAEDPCSLASAAREELR